jgi:hypothetical protein
MTKAWRVLVGAIGALLLAFLVGRFLVPVPDLQGTKLVSELADPDSQFITIRCTATA